MKPKREFPKFAPWDAHGMARHLESMEARGWRLRDTDILGRWVYDPCTPAQACYAVTYAPSRKNWRLTPTEAERDLEDLCSDAAWHKLAALSRFHIYCSDAPDAPPLETEESVRLATIRRCFGRDMLLSTLLWILNLWLYWWSIPQIFASDLPELIASSLIPLLLVMTLWTFFEWVIPGLFYFTWMKAARKAAETGSPCPEVRHWRMLKSTSRMTSAVLLLVLLTGGSFWMLALYGILFGIFLLGRHVLSKRQEAPEEIERKYQNLLFFFAIGILLLNFYFNHADLTTPPAPPVTITDLTGNQGEHLQMDHSKGIFAEYNRYDQVESGTEETLHVTYFAPHVPIFEEECGAWFHSCLAYDDAPVTREDPAPWGAMEVWRRENSWLLFYEDCTVVLSPSWELTDSQIAAAAQALKGGA